MVVEGGVGATSNGREVVVGEAVIVQGGLTDGRGGVEEGVCKGGRPCWVRTIE
jgi:hypothetical protein